MSNSDGKGCQIVKLDCFLWSEVVTVSFWLFADLKMCKSKRFIGFLEWQHVVEKAKMEFPSSSTFQLFIQLNNQRETNGKPGKYNAKQSQMLRQQREILLGRECKWNMRRKNTLRLAKKEPSKGRISVVVNPSSMYNMHNTAITNHNQSVI